MLAKTSAARLTAAREAWALVLELWLRHKRHFAEVAAQHDLSPMQLHLLQTLTEEEPQPMSRLATSLACDASHVTGIVDRLEQGGLVERRASARDRRVKLIALTERGVTLRSVVLEDLLEPPAEIACLVRAEQRALRDLLRHALGY